MTVLALQRRLLSLGFNPGAPDGLYGPATEAAINKALDRVPKPQVQVAPVQPKLPASKVVPMEWMPWAKMDRVIFHWTAGGHKASALDRKHYHLLIETDGMICRGDLPISANAAPIKGAYAAHTLNCNSGSIGVSLCGMAGAVESPFSAGKNPITFKQWDELARVIADLCRRYSIPVTPGTVLSHAEVQATLKIKQKGKWDIARLPWDPSLRGAKAIGDQMRAAVSDRLH